MTHRRRMRALKNAVALAVGGFLSGCMGFGSAPDVKTATVMDNFKKAKQERIVSDRNYKVGERYRVQTGEVRIRTKLYTLVPESAGGYRTDLDIALIGDGQRLNIPAGLKLKTADRQLVNGRLANLLPLPQPLAGAPDVTALFANDDGTLVPAVMRGGRVASFAKFEVAPEKAQLSPELMESVKTSAGYVNYEVVYNANGVFSYINCATLRTPGKPPPNLQTAPASGTCGSGPHLDLTVVEYDRLQLDRASKANRAWYPVRERALDLPGLKVTIHEIAPTHIVFEVTKDDYTYGSKTF